MKKHTKMLAAAAVLPLFAACSAGGDAEAAEYPADCSNIQILVSTSAGGSTDLAFRALADELSDELGTRVQVANVTGGGGITAFNQLFDAPADGCTLASTNLPDHLNYIFPESPATYSKEDFSFAAGFVVGPQVLVVTADSPYKTLDDLIEAGSERGHLIGVADSPKGGDSVINAQFASAAGVNIQQVVVDGSVEKVTAVLSGQVDFSSGSIGGVMASISSGDLRPLAVWSDKRLNTLPDVPTAAEQGINVVIETQYALGMSSDVPDKIRQRLEEAVKAATQADAFIGPVSNLGLVVRFQNGEEFSQSWDDYIKTIEGINFDSLQ